MKKLLALSLIFNATMAWSSSNTEDQNHQERWTIRTYLNHDQALSPHTITQQPVISKTVLTDMRGEVEPIEIITYGSPKTSSTHEKLK